MEGAEHEDGITLAGLDHLLLDVVVDGRLLGGHEARTHVDAVGTQCKGGREALAVAKATRRQEGDLELAGSQR